jgi:serine/threonine-protein kinase
LGEDDAVAIPGTDGARDPFFSPDGQWLGYFVNQGLFKVSLAGGAPQKITDAPTETNRGASWGQDGTIILPLGQWSGLYRVSDAGGDPEPLTVPDESERSAHYFPQILPDGDVLFTIWRDAGWAIALLDIRTGEWEEIAHGCGGARWIATDHLICLEMRGMAATGNVLAARFDSDRRALAGDFRVPAPAVRSDRIRLRGLTQRHAGLGGRGAARRDTHPGHCRCGRRNNAVRTGRRPVPDASSIA